MGKAQYTPGPYITDGGSHVQALYNPTDGGRPFYHTIARTDQPLVTPEQASANSKLFASALKMLEALKFALAELNQCAGADDFYKEMVRTAIAEAEGN